MGVIPLGSFIKKDVYAFHDTFNHNKNDNRKSYKICITTESEPQKCQNMF